LPSVQEVGSSRQRLAIFTPLVQGVDLSCCQLLPDSDQPCVPQETPLRRLCASSHGALLTQSTEPSGLTRARERGAKNRYGSTHFLHLSPLSGMCQPAGPVSPGISGYQLRGLSKWHSSHFLAATVNGRARIRVVDAQWRPPDRWVLPILADIPAQEWIMHL